ncbi:hypothetical protein [Candidatus Shikimatogenerans bostrichidophilus]|uniref:hypothetical protein n=1 Tax=Candidatus Shikimatogenerans bostrichidophilus TaxID=2943807 RepID=UPI002967713B
MTYILNINENNNYIFSNISYNGKLLYLIKNTYNSIHKNINKCLFKNKFNINKLNAVCVNLGPSIYYFKIRSILSSAKGICLALNIPLIIVNDYLLILINKKKCLIKKYNKIIFIFFSYNKKIIYIKIYDFKKFKKLKIINNIYKFINKNKNYYFFINKKYKKLIKYNLFIYNNFNFYKINYLKIINLSYYFYKEKQYIKNNNINLCEPIYI